MTAAACSSQSHPFAAPTFAVVVEDERYRVVDSPRNGGDAEILRHLGELLKQYHSIGEAGVNARLPSCDPWDIPAMPVDEGEGSKMREKYFVTDDCTLKSSCTPPATKSGYWKPRDLGWGIPSSEVIGPALVTGLKTTYDFHIGETIYQEGSKGTSWIMDVYFLIDNGQVEDDLLLCHVFKGNSRDYVARPRCAAHHHESPKEKEIQGQSNNSLLERPGGLLATHISSNKHLSPSHQQASKENGSLAQHQGFQLPNHICNQNTGEPNHQAIYNQSDAGECNHQAIYDQNNGFFDLTEMGLLATTDSAFQPLSPLSSICLENLANIENPGLEIPMDTIENGVPWRVSPASAENGPLGKRARTKSAVWQKFTKLVTKAKAVLAVCNHCYRVMSGDSSNGTSHLKRHKCHCNH